MDKDELSRADGDDGFRLAFTVLILDRYRELADQARALAPQVDTHAMVVEAIRMVDEAPADTDHLTGEQSRVIATSDWLSDWVVEAIHYLAKSPYETATRLGRPAPGWEAVGRVQDILARDPMAAVLRR